MKNNIREIHGLLNFERTMLYELFQKFGDLETSYRDVQEYARRKFRVRVSDFVQLIDCLNKMGYVIKSNGKRNLTIRIIKSEE